MLQLTDAARDALRSAIDQTGQDVAGVRIMVTSGGCAGLKYGMALELAADADDAVLRLDQLTVLIDPESSPHLDDVTIDFVTGLDGSGFVFDNPRAASQCGCGRSFC